MTAKPNAPHGYHAVTPYFTVHDADRLIEFLSTAFDAAIIKEHRYDDGKIQHARMCIGDSLLMLNECSEAYPANVSQMHLYVEDADTTYTTALSAGAISLMEPNDRPHGDRMAGIEDPCGNIWWIVNTQIEIASDSKWHSLPAPSGRPLFPLLSQKVDANVDESFERRAIQTCTANLVNLRCDDGYI